MTFEHGEVKLSNLLLDPNNYRFGDEGESRRVATRRFAEQGVQDRAMARLKQDGLGELKQSILSNGFVPVERIVVRKWEPEVAAGAGAQAAGLETPPDDAAADEGAEPAPREEKYVVVEGNRRVAALKWLLMDHEQGIEVPGNVREVFDKVPVLFLDSDDETIYLSIMGIRHVGGIKEWGGHQSARLVYELRHEHALSAQDVGSRLGLSAVEINRRYRAYQAMQQMKRSEEYSEYVTPELYPLFHEALVAPKTREWLGWSDETWEAMNAETREQFYSLISPYRDASGTDRPPKITSYSEVREIKGLIDNADAMESLLDLDKAFSDALALAKSADASKNWLSKVAGAISALDHLGIREIRRLDGAQRGKLTELRDLIDDILKDNEEAADAAEVAEAASEGADSAAGEAQA
jgi:hypothetical protein